VNGHGRDVEDVLDNPRLACRHRIRAAQPVPGQLAAARDAIGATSCVGAPSLIRTTS
jgi:hypothetical protein